MTVVMQGNTAIISTASDLIRASMRKLGVIAPGEALEAGELSDALVSLNAMLDTWSADKLYVFSNTRETLELIQGSGSYSIGIGGDLDTERPIAIVNAFITRNGVDFPINVNMTEREYENIRVKNIQAPPTRLFYRPSFPLGIVYFDYLPDMNYQMTLVSHKRLNAISSVTSDIAMPPGYQEALIYNLCIVLAPEYGKQISQEIQYKATESISKLQSLNVHIEPVTIDLCAFGMNSTGNIYNGWSS